MRFQAVANSRETMQFADFIKLFSDVSNHVRSMERAKSKFQELDVDRSGFLETQEIGQTLDWVLLFYTREGEVLSPEERESIRTELVAVADTNKDGRLSLAEFTIIFSQIENRKEEVRRRKSVVLF